MNLRLPIRPIILAIFVSCAALGSALAQGASVSLGVKDHDSSTPVEITSVELELDQANGTAIFKGDVIVVQGDVTLTCQRMRVEYGPNATTGQDEIQVIRLFGGVTFVSDAEAAESDNAVYTLANDIIIMSGNVLVTQGQTALSSDKLTYNLDTGDGVMEGNVKTILQQGRN